MKKLLLLVMVCTLVLGLAAWAGEGKSKPATSSKMGAGTTMVTGWISDDKCGAKGASEKAASCTKKCIEGGAKAVLVNDADGKVWAIDNPDAVKGHEGHHVTVGAQLDNEKNSAHISTLKMAEAAPRAQKPKS